jgi:pimeloyl-ACP methyl ester carboxylesterase
MRLQANGIEIDAEVEGPASGPSILLIRGLGTQHVQWPRAFLEALVARGLRVVRFDNRDIGLSTRFAAESAPAYTLADMAADSVGVLEALGIESAHWFGISLGGAVAQRATLDHPKRVRSLISVMAPSGAPGVPPAGPEIQRLLFEPPPDPRDREASWETFLRQRRAFGSPKWRDPDEVVRAEFDAVYARGLHPAGVRRQMQALLADRDRWQELGRIRTPTLVIHGDSDPLVPHPAGGDTAKRIPGAIYKLLPGMGHDIPLALAPRLANLAARFIERIEMG